MNYNRMYKIIYDDRMTYRMKYNKIKDILMEK